MRSFERSGLSNLTTPSISATIAVFLGRLASNSSLTLGRPPVISFDLATAFGVLAKMSAWATSSPLETKIAVFGSSGYLIKCPLFVVIMIAGFTPLGKYSLITRRL